MISFEKAKRMLPKGKQIHTFRETPFCLIGADWPRGDIIKVLKKYPVNITGLAAQATNHGLAIKDERGWLFIETIKAEK